MKLTSLLSAACFAVVCGHAVADDYPTAPAAADSVTDRYVAKAR